MVVLSSITLVLLLRPMIHSQATPQHMMVVLSTILVLAYVHFNWIFGNTASVGNQIYNDLGGIIYAEDNWVGK